MASKLIDKMPANSYIGDAMLSPNNQINTNYTYGQRAINSYNKKGFFSAVKELVKNPPNSSPYNYSSDSYIPLIKRAYKYPDKFKLSYITSEYQPFNDQGLYGTLTNNLKQTEDIKQQLNIINESIEKANPNARKAMIKNGEIVLPHPMLFKKN